MSVKMKGVCVCVCALRDALPGEGPEDSQVAHLECIQDTAGGDATPSAAYLFQGGSNARVHSFDLS